NQANAIANGDLTGQVMARSDRDVFSIAFQKLLDNLRLVVLQLTRRSGELRRTAGELAVSAQHQSQEIMDQSSSIHQSFTILEQIKATVDVANSLAQSMQTLSTQTVDASRVGQEYLEDSVKANLRLAEQVESVSKNIEYLSTRVAQIVEITD